MSGATFADLDIEVVEVSAGQLRLVSVGPKNYYLLFLNQNLWTD